MAASILGGVEINKPRSLLFAHRLGIFTLAEMGSINLVVTRSDVLRAYERRCAVCDYDIRLGDELLGLEAAHIEWHAAGGPDAVSNGLALCGFHHKAFDRGAWGLEPKDQGYRILVSEEVHGQSRALGWLRDYHGEELRQPLSGPDVPSPRHVAWHTEQVFRRPSLPMAG